MSNSASHPHLSADEAFQRRYLKQQKEVDQLSIFKQIALVVNHSLELDEVLPQIADHVQASLDVRRLTIYRYFKKEDVIRPVVAKYGKDLIERDRLEEEFQPRQGNPLGEILDSRETVLREGALYQELYVPLVAKNEPIGIMKMEDPKDSHPFGQYDPWFWHDLATPISIAIYNAHLYALAVTDGLTGLYVRRYFDLRMEEEFAEAERYERVFSLMMFDIDHFKKFNDTHGHQTGDMVLKQFAQLLKENTRASDICCRYGGEEMSVILPGTDLEEAGMLAEKLCETIRSHTFIGTGEKELHVTSSIGVADYQSKYNDQVEIVEAADQCLYRAKEGGRDRVEVAK